mmetsp:Transcript_73955/g.213945  ORF Transcript_73955/g.213945 Transcript_73955/m.213945 type:complete len:253 (+) Transcript_73955:441-1199(+)
MHRRVDRSEPEARASALRNGIQLLVRPIRDRKHGAILRKRLRGLCSCGDDVHGLRERQEATGDGSGVLAEGMARNCDRRHAHGFKDLAQGVLNDEERRLGHGGARELPLQLLVTSWGAGEQLRPKIHAQALRRQEELASLVGSGPEQRRGCVQPPRHLEILAPLARENKGHLRTFRGLLQVFQLLNVRKVVLQLVKELLNVIVQRRHHHGFPQGQGRPACLQGVGHLACGDSVRPPTQAVGQGVYGVPQRGG